MDATISASDDGKMVIRLANGNVVSFDPSRGSGTVEAWRVGATLLYQASHADASNVWSAVRAALPSCTCESYEYGSGGDVPSTCEFCLAQREVSHV
jgi:hypothetical protein